MRALGGHAGRGVVGTRVDSRVREPAVGLETTLLVHGLPSSSSRTLADRLDGILARCGASSALCGVVDGRPVVGMTRDELEQMIRLGDAGEVPKANTANLGLMMHRGRWAATTVSTTMELCALAGVGIFATGGLGGVHRGYGQALDISADLAAFTRFPVAVVTSGVKSILDVVSTREALETLGVPVVGYRTDRFPAFYVRESDVSVDARFDDPHELADFVRFEVGRTHRGVVVANPIPEEHAIDPDEFDRWLREAETRASAAGARGRDVTPAILRAISEISGGQSLRANLALVESNVTVAGTLAASPQPR